jgi:hypothetical protein
MWRPGKLRFLIGVENPLPIRPTAAARNTAPCGAAPVARFANFSRTTPSFRLDPAMFSHPNRRSPRILIAAQQVALSMMLVMSSAAGQPQLRGPIMVPSSVPSDNTAMSATRKLDRPTL